MKLTQLDASFLQYASDGFQMIAGIEGADGVKFQCPKCSEGLEKTETYVIGAHSVICWFVGKVPDSASPGPGRWAPSGTSLNDLTLTPSVFLEKSCGWHGYVTNGDAQ